MFSGHNSPCCIIPHRGQFPENVSKPPNSEHWRVFHEYDLRFHLANDPSHFGPQSASLPVQTVPVCFGARDVLAWEPAADDIGSPSPRNPVEGSHVIPDREAWQHPIPLPLQEHLAAVGFDFNGANRVMSEKDAAEDSSPASCK
jgi:hypothetical protein